MVVGNPTDLYGKQANIDYDHGKVVNDYSREQPRCTMVHKVEYKDVCEPYTERVGVIEPKRDRRCFDVTELICGLKEEVQFDTIVEEFQVQLCTVMKERLCDTSYVIGQTTRDDF